MKSDKEILDAYLRPELVKLLAQCSESQQRKFKRIFGEVKTMPAEKIPSAVALCERTVKNIEPHFLRKHNL
ncbi:unnamed protein product [marine sediment metagenome]|uniref:Uncharacterized protein n=1 Tax=marine sediment metagenome TaxID=412755 RepID=X0X155_9ZZZZ